MRVKTKGMAEKAVAASITRTTGGGDGVESATGATENKSDTTMKTAANIYQQLGWETTDLDDIDDLL